MRVLECGVLVLGGGLAALRAAIAAREAGADVLLACRGKAGRGGATPISSGGIAAVLPDAEPADSAAIFAEDLLRSGQGIGDPALVQAVVAEHRACVEELPRFGIDFLRSGGRWDRAKSPGHSQPRSLRADPQGYGAKGLGCTLPLAAYARAAGVNFWEGVQACGLCMDGGRVAGAWLVDLARDELWFVQAGAVIVATGGYGYLWSRTNVPRDCTGMGLAMALDAGAQLCDMEFVQFHPTRMVWPVSMFVSEGLMADGAVLRNRDGEEFMWRYHPHGSRAPRDIKSRAIFLEVEEGRGLHGGVYLDCAGVPMERILLRHKELLAALKQRGHGFPQEPIVVSPAAHFCMGGIAIDPTGATAVEGLFAAGEAARGIHGANRLGSTALTEALVIGRRAGEAAARASREREGRAAAGRPPAAPAWLGPAPKDLPDLNEGWRALREAMWRWVSIARDAAGLEAALATLQALGEAWRGAAAPSPRQAAQVVEFQAALRVAEACTRAALLRQESRGAHWRRDYPEPAAGWQGNIWIAGAPEGLALRYVPAAPALTS